MTEVLFFNIIFSFALFMIGLGFLSGFLRGAYKFTINFDKLFFSNARDGRIFKIADEWAFIFCFLMAVCTLSNGFISYFCPAIPNVSAIFFFIAIFLSLPIRYIFTIIYKNKKYESIPIVWPFKNKKIASWIDD
jgi:hypothetical protein